MSSGDFAPAFIQGSGSGQAGITLSVAAVVYSALPTVGALVASGSTELIASRELGGACAHGSAAGAVQIVSSQTKKRDWSKQFGAPIREEVSSAAHGVAKESGMGTAWV
eukprot:3929607-Prymnesium_polylepis.1